ncbi:11300_t:CDS:2 [Paraglomus brasilianum]|uniref:11300_t:CDS:1 n=1 Tax=Paraglomus brasilianum TaxID=144538 RepID=A0A9N8VIZ1_9GLOM|nr:11300_t:CDS:2 [Paraglomus brasilianum]
MGRLNKQKQRSAQARLAANRDSKKQNAERRKTVQSGWFDIPKAEITPEIKRHLQLLKLRDVLDPKRFYKKGDLKELPTHFQIGTIVEGPADPRSARLTRKEKRRTVVDQLLADEEAKTYYKRKFLEIQETKQSGGKKFYKRLRNRQKPNWQKGF